MNALRQVCVGLLGTAALVLGALPGAVAAADDEGAASTRSFSKEELLQRLATRQSQLALEQARADMEMARVEHEETRRLFDAKVVTIDKLNKAKQTYQKAALAFRTAEIELEKTRLGFLKDATLVTVLDAKKYRTEDGQYMVSVTIRNDSDLGKARTAMEEEDSVLSDQELASLLQLDNVIVTLIGKADMARFRDEGQRAVEAIIGDPYQRIVPVLAHDQTVELTYQLLKKDVEAVTIRVAYLGTQREYPVFLKREASQELPTATSTQYAQQGQLGRTIRYDLLLERLGKEDRSFSLIVLNLPSQITFAFRDPRSDARVTQVKFTEEISKQSLDLEIAIPERLDQELVDKNISFDVFVTRPAELKAVSEIRKQYRGESIPAEALATIKGSRVELILIPKGVGKLDILMTNQYKEVQEGDPAGFKFSILNSGTLALRQVTPELDLPLEWEGGASPKSMSYHAWVTASDV